MANTTTPIQHYLLNNIDPGNVVIACYALESMVRLAQMHGSPLRLHHAREWLKGASEPDDIDDGWLEWRLDQIFT